MTRPIVFLLNFRDYDMPYDQKALATYLRRNYQAQIMNYSHPSFFLDYFEKFRPWFSCGAVPLIIIEQDRYDDSSLPKDVERIQQLLGNQTTIILLPSMYSRSPQDLSAFRCRVISLYGSDFTATIDQLMKGWLAQAPQDIPDIMIPMVKPTIKPPPPEIYENDLVRFTTMSPAERETLLNSYLRQNSVSAGPNNHGFAIDSETLEYEITTGFGNHSLASLHLVQILMRLDWLAGKEMGGKREAEYYQRVYQGRITTTRELTTPVLTLYTGGDDLSSPELSRVIKFINQQKWLLITAYDHKNQCLMVMIDK